MGKTVDNLPLSSFDGFQIYEVAIDTILVECNDEVQLVFPNNSLHGYLKQWEPYIVDDTHWIMHKNRAVYCTKASMELFKKYLETNVSNFSVNKTAGDLS